MRQYILRRLLISAVVLIGVSMLVYALARSMPADYVSLSTATIQKITQEQKDNLRRIYGLDKNIPAGYV
ncbi:MAG: glutathione ABC transporter permease GsiC, partial [Treponema sp.]|nr:glutathione ABC transporter permease GsiC [Treponema sp.]